MNDFAVKIENLSKVYKKGFFSKSETYAVSSLNIEVPNGVVLGFLGPNGAGKTTTIRCLMDLIRPTSGKAWIFGKEIGNTEIKEKIGFLPDSPTFGGHLTAYNFLYLSAKLLKIPKQEINSRVEEVLTIVKMKEYSKEKLGGFSRGMTQRIGIAQAILNRPKLLVLDEPLVGLDPHGRKELIEIVQDQKERGSTIFFCSHILSDVESLCDYVGIMKKGQLKAFGKIEELLAESGIIMTIKKDDQTNIETFLPKADSSKKNDNGDWELSFSQAQWEQIKTDSSHLIGETIHITPHRESLEKFFFKTIGEEDSTGSSF